MAKNVSLQSIVGKKGIPTAYIRKVTLSPGTRPAGMDMDFGESLSSDGLVTRVELSLADIKRGNRFQWVTDERLHKYLRIRVIESRNNQLTKLLSDGGLTTEQLNRAKLKYNFREKIISLKSDRNIEDVERIRRGNSVVYMFPYEAEFFIPNLRPDHLAYFCSCYIDTVAITRDFGAKIKNKRFREVQGYVSGDLVISNGLPVSSSSVYKLPNGSIHPGAVHFHETKSGGQYMVGPRHTQKKHSVLERVQIPNFKIQDQRIFKMLEDLSFNIGPDDDTFKKIKRGRSKKSAQGTKFSKKPNFISSAFVSRDSDGKSNIMFSIDTHRVLRENGQFGKILNSENPELFNRVSDLSRISSFKLFRQRVEKNNLSSNPRSKYKIFKDEKRELIARNSEKSAGQFRRRVYKIDKDGDDDREVRIGMVKEIDLLNANRLRTFSCTDFDMSRVTDGIYQYVVEVEMDDGTSQYVAESLKRLKRNKIKLVEYYNQSMLAENFNVNSNKFTQEFVNLLDRRYPQLSNQDINNVPNLARQKSNPSNSSNSPWNESIAILMETVGSLTNMSSDNISFVASNLHALINPKTGTPTGIASFIEAYEKVENKIGRLLNTRGVGEAQIDVNARSSIHKERFKRSNIKLEKRFKEVFNSDTEKNIEYDFLGGRKNNRGGIREITLDFYQNRITREGEKYFSGPLRRSRVPILDLRETQYAYLSPARVKYGIKTLNILNAGRATWSRKRYNEATSIIASMKLDPTREELSAPIGTARNLEGSQGVKEILSQNILAHRGITIERPAPRPKRIKTREGIDTPDIIGEDTLQLATTQALELSEEDFEEQVEIAENNRRQRHRNLRPLNSMFVNKIINKESSDMFKISDRRGIPAGLAGFDISRSDNILEKLYRDQPGLSTKLRALPNQIKALFLSRQQITTNKWHDAKTDFLLNPDTFEMIRYNHFMLQRVEYLSGFETTNRDGRQITKPVFSLMDPSTLQAVPGKKLLCRMSTYKNPKVYAEIPDSLKLPIRDEYFLIKFSDDAEALENVEADDQAETNEASDRAARRLSRTSSSDRFAKRILETLLEKERRAENYYQFSSTIFVKQPRDLIQEGAEIKSTTTEPRPSRPSATPTRARRQASRTTRSRPATRQPRGTGGSGGGGY
jgi:hypothetical protein